MSLPKQRAKDSLQLHADLRSKLVLHRGWHHLGNAATKDRPLENTRQAYQDAAFVGTAYAECDVWATQDGHLVLCHDSTMRGSAADPSDAVATTPVSELRWEVLKRLELRDGSTPVLLDTVLEDLLPTSTRLAIELKNSSCATPLVEGLARSPQLLPAVGFLLSFSLRALEIVASSLDEHCGVALVWLVDNPKVPYSTDDLNEGETTFDYLNESLPSFLERHGLADRVRALRCGLYLQYSSAATSEALCGVRAAMRESCGEGALLGLWGDRSLDPEVDSMESLATLLDAVDIVNSDLPEDFFGVAAE